MESAKLTTIPNIQPIVTVQEVSPITLSAEKPRLHLAYLEGMRALAALFVLVHHSWLIAYWGVRRPPTTLSYLLGWIVYGHFAVDVFIVLSGFCLMLPVVRGDGTVRGGAKEFFKRRARRILPPYYFALALSLLLATTILSHKTDTLWDYSVPVTKTGVLAHLLLVHNVHHAMQINSPMWSVAVEWQIYFLFPLIVLGWTRLGGARTTLAVICISYAALYATQHTKLSGLTCHYVGLFALGMLGASVSFSQEPAWDAVRNRFPWKPAAVVLSFLLIAICCYWHEAGVNHHLGGVDFVVGLWTLTLLIVVSDPRPTPLRRLLSWKPLVFIGTFSYSIYLLHLPLLQVCWQYGLQPLHLNKALPFGLLTTAAGGMVVAVSYVFFVFCERLFMNAPMHKQITT